MDDFPTPLDIIVGAWIRGNGSLYTLSVFNIDAPSDKQGEAFFYLREETSRKLLLPIFTSELMALRFIQDHPVDNAKIITIHRTKFNILMKSHKVSGIVLEPSLDPLYFRPIFID